MRTEKPRVKEGYFCRQANSRLNKKKADRKIKKGIR